MSIQKMMTTKLISVAPTDTVGRMNEILSKLPIHHLLVVEEGELVGVVSDRDVLRCMSPFVNTHVEDEKDRFTTQRMAKQIMTRDPVTINVSEGILSAARSMLDNKVSLLPVVNDQGTLIGVLSWKDVLRFLIE